jgi:hypothetical protein
MSLAEVEAGLEKAQGSVSRYDAASGRPGEAKEGLDCHFDIIMI